MSDPAPRAPEAEAPAPDTSPGAGPAAPAPPRAAPRPARTTDTLTLVLLCAAVGGVIFAASPALLRASGALPSPYHDDTHFPLHHPPIGDHPTFADDGDEDEDEPRETELEKMYPDGMWPGRRGDGESRQTFRGQNGRGAAPGAHGPQRGQARGPLQIFDDPGGHGAPLGKVQAGSTVMVLIEDGDWVLVSTRDAESGAVITGWAKKNEIAVR